jgi:hypothetical protein
VRRVLTDVAGAILMFLRSILGGYRDNVLSYVAIISVRGWCRLECRTGALLNGYLERNTVCRVILVVPYYVPALQQTEQVAMRLAQTLADSIGGGAKQTVLGSMAARKSGASLPGSAGNISLS